MNKYKYEAKIIQYDDMNDVVTVNVNGSTFNCFCFGMDINLLQSSDKWIVTLEVLDINFDNIGELEFFEKGMSQINNSLAYILKGIYDTNTQSLDIGFNIDLSGSGMFDCGYLHGKYIFMEINRLDIKFLKPVKD